MNIKWPARHPRRRYCCITMVRDEEPFLRQWLSHYTRSLPDVSFIVIDHASRRPVKNFLKSEAHDHAVDVVTLPDIPFDDEYKSAALSAMAGIALGACSTVISSDVDELVIPLSPVLGEKPLSALIDSEQGSYVAPIGMEFIHNAELEGDFDFERPLLEQRDFVRFHSAYSKPVIWRASETTFGAGQHRIFDKYDFAGSLGLAHLKYVDEKSSQQRQSERTAVVLSEEQIAKGRGKMWANMPSSGGWARATFQEARGASTDFAAGNVYADFVEQLKLRLDDSGQPIKNGVAHNLRLVSPVLRYSLL